MTVVEYLKKKGYKNFASAAKEMIGKKVKIIAYSSTAGSVYGNIGDVFTIDCWANPNQTTGLAQTLNGQLLLNAPSYYMQLNCIEMYSEETIKDIEQRIQDNNGAIKNLEQENKRLQTKIQFMTENKLEKFDEDEFKVYAVLQELGKRSTPIQKAQAIAKLIKA